MLSIQDIEKRTESFRKAMVEVLQHLDVRLAMERTYDERDDIEARVALERAKRLLGDSPGH